MYSNHQGKGNLQIIKGKVKHYSWDYENGHSMLSRVKFTLLSQEYFVPKYLQSLSMVSQQSPGP